MGIGRDRTKRECPGGAARTGGAAANGALRRLGGAVLGLAVTASWVAMVPDRVAMADGGAGVAIESPAAALARLDSLQAIVRAEEDRVRRSPGVEGGWTRLARAWFQLGDHARAAQCLARARTMGGREFDTALLSGRVARSEGRLGQAIDWLRQAARMRPADWEVHEDLGLALYLDGRAAGAADHWQRARALPGSGSPDRAGLIEALRRLGPRAYEMSGRGRERLRFVPQRTRGPLVVSVRLNGRGPYPMRVDPGSPEVALQASLARELGLAVFPDSNAAPPAAARGGAPDYTVLDSLTLGATTLHRLPAVVMPDPEPTATGEPRGLIGLEALRRFRFCIDTGDSTLWLDAPQAAGTEADATRPEWAPAGARVHRVPVLLRGAHLLIATGQVNHGPPRPFVLDAGGAGVAFSAPASTLAEAGITLDSTRVLTGVSTGVITRYVPFTVDRLCVADACLDSLPGAYGTFPPRLERNPSFRLAGIVSGEFLTRFRIGVDVAGREVWLVER